MAFCKYCGKELPESGICDCAEAQQAAATTETADANQTSDTEQASTEVAVSENKNSNKSLIIIAVAVIVGLILLSSILSSLFGGYKKPVENYFSGLQKSSSSKFLKAFPEDKADDFKDMIEDDYDDDFDDFFDDLIEDFEDDYGRKIKFKIDFEDKDEMKNRDIKAFEELYDVEISKAYEVEFTLTVKGKKDKDDLDYIAYVGKVKGEGWKLLTTPYED